VKVSGGSSVTFPWALLNTRLVLPEEKGGLKPNKMGDMWQGRFRAFSGDHGQKTTTSTNTKFQALLDRENDLNTHIKTLPSGTKAEKKARSKFTAKLYFAHLKL